MNLIKFAKSGRYDCNRLLRLVFALAVVFLGTMAFADFPAPSVYWKMNVLNADGDVPDLSGNGNDLQIGTGCTLTNDMLCGTVLQFNGSTNAWGYSRQKSQFAGSRTIVMTIRREATDGPMDPTVNKIPYLISSVSGTMVNYGWDSLYYNICASGASAFIGSSKTSREEWYHLVFVVERDDDASVWKLRCYTNGEVSYSNDNPIYGGNPISANTGSQRILVGNNGWGDSGTRPFFGRMGEIRVYPVALSADEARKLYLDSIRERPASLIGRWEMERIDDSGATRVIPPTGTAMVDLIAASGIALTANGVAGKAADFPNMTDVGLSLVTPDVMSGFSFGVWLNFSTNLVALEYETVVNKIPHVFVMGKYCRMCVEGAYRGTTDNRAHVFDVGTFDDANDQGFVCPRVTVQKGRWSHLGVSYEMRMDEGSGLYGVQPRIYVDGDLVSTGRWRTASALTGVYPKGAKFVLGNNGIPASRSFGGQMDELCFFSGVLSDGQMRELAAGLPIVSAGEDFTVAVAEARLDGVIGKTGTLGNRKAAKVAARWSFVDTPEGGAGATFAHADDLRTVVSLPVEGRYVIRLTITDMLGRTAFDDVAVTRTVAVNDNVRPVVSVSGSDVAEAFAPVAMTALAADADGGPGTLRISWKVVSGPSAVRFEPAQGASTKATFFGEGVYRIAAVASDGMDETVASAHSVTVSASPGINLDNGLISYWPFEVGKTNFITGTSYAVDLSSITWETGLDAYGIRCNMAFAPYLDTNTTLLETVDPDTAENGYNEPKERYRAISCWIYHDPSDTNNSCCATIVDVPYTLGLWYNCENGVRGFTMYQQTLNTAIGGAGNTNAFPRPAVDPLGRWTHVYALFDRKTYYTSNTSELWIDGVKQTPYFKSMGGGRVHSNELMIGGHMFSTGAVGSNGHFKDENGNWLSRTFPGVIDEVRMYNRALTEAEIKYLANNPVVGIRRPPAVSGEPDMLMPTVRKAKTVEVKVNSDSYPASATLTYAWCVLSGDASKLVFADPTARATTVTAMKPGAYVVQLAVSDGARTVYSAPIPLDVQQAGITISFK